MTIGKRKKKATLNLKERIVLLLEGSEPLTCREIVGSLLQIKISLKSTRYSLTNKNLPTPRAMHQILKKDNRFSYRFDEKTKLNVWKLRGN